MDIILPTELKLDLNMEKPIHSFSEQEKMIRALQNRIKELEHSEISHFKENTFPEPYIDNHPDIFLIFNPANQKIIKWNRSFSDITGYSEKEIEELVAPYSCFLEEHKDPLRDLIRSVNKKGEGSAELPFFTKTGMETPCHIRMTRFINNEGEALILLIGRKLSVEEVIKPVKTKNEDKFRLLANNSVDVIWQMDMKLKFTYVSPSIYDMTGYTDIEWTGTYLHNHCRRKEFLKMAGIAIRAIKNFRKFKYTVFETEFLNKKGEAFPVEITGKILRNSFGIPIGLQGSTHDISRRKKDEKELLETRKKYEILYKNALIGLFSVDLESGRFLQANETAARMAGYNNLQEFIDKYRTIDSYVRPDERTLLINTLKEKGEIINYQVELYNKNREKYWIELSGTLDRDKNILEAAGVDITRRKKTEQELKDALIKAEESDKLKTAFLMNLSHEIRTPMNGLLGFADLLKSQYLSDEKKLKYIDVIKRSGNRMLSTINDLMDISLIESGQVKIKLSDVNLNTFCLEIFSFFHTETKSKGIDLNFQIPDKKGIILHTDKGMFTSIVTNLLKNAIKYTHHGSIQCGYKLFDKQIKFFVRDSGIGIPYNKQDVIFDRFVQAHQDGEQVYEGTGLGLSIARAYVEMLGGNMNMESKPGEGSVFYFSLPINNFNDDNTKREINSSIFGEKRKLKIIVAEDEKSTAKYLNIILEEIASEILFAEDGKTVVELSKENPDIDLILMDIKMPEMNGYDATRNIRQFNREVIIIAQTAYAQAGDREQAIRAGCNNYIAKPLRKSELLEIIKTEVG